MYSYFRSLQFKITLSFAVMVLIILWLGISVLALTNTIPVWHKQSDTWPTWMSWSALSAMTTGILLALCAARHLIKVVCGGLNRQTGKFSEMATLMDFSKRSASPRKDEFGKSAKAFDGFLQSIENAVTTVIHATASVTMATREIAQGNMDLSRRTEEQATALEQTAHSMQRLTDAIRHTTDNAVQANQRANEANALAQSGSASMQKMNDTITRLEQSSKQISEITTLIDGIAFQTNILALNAAVEAARAGEQGRGFAVVASEVRHLASRSSSAAKDIRNLIDDSVGMVHSSLQQAHDVGNTVRQVQQAIASVSEIVDAISTGSQDQRQRAEHIDTTIAHMDQSTQQNAALVEQVAAAAHSLEEQSERLTHAVSAFRVSHVQTSQPPLSLPLQQATIGLPAHA